MLTIFAENNDEILTRITRGGWWKLVDEWRTSDEGKRILDRDMDRQLRRIRAYWQGLPVKQKRSGKRTPWLKQVIEAWLDWTQQRASYEGVLTTKTPSGFSLRAKFSYLDDVYEYLAGSGLIETYGMDDKGRTMWMESEYVVIRWNEEGIFEVWVKESGG